MKAHYPGVSDSSDIYFYTPSAQARGMYFYPLCTGHYDCDKNYVVDRQSYDSFLILYVCSGCGYVEQDGRTIPCQSGSFAFLDCYRPHRYYTKTGWEIYWVHFDGVLARPYYEQATPNGFVVSPPNPYNAAHSLRSIFRSFHENSKANEPILSKRITDLLTELVLASNAGTAFDSRTAIMEDTLAFISANAADPITLGQLARRVNISPFYFIRVFKKETGFTPHEYIIQVRVNLAKFYLKSTNLSLQEIAFRSGFSSECNFCTGFKKVVGSTPGVFRKEAPME